MGSAHPTIGRIRPPYELSRPTLPITRYSGIAMTSSGIIMVARIASITRLAPRKRLRARAYAERAHHDLQSEADRLDDDRVEQAAAQAEVPRGAEVVQ